MSPLALNTAHCPVTRGQRRLPQSSSDFLFSFCDFILLMLLSLGGFLRIMPLLAWIMKLFEPANSWKLSVTKFREHAAYFFQKLPDAFCGSILAGGDILKIVAMGSHPHDFHLLLGDTF